MSPIARGLVAVAAATLACAHPRPGDRAPVGSPGWCSGDDATGIALAAGGLDSELAPATARAALDARNEICGDTWCEGSFEWFAYDLRGAATRSEITMRTYSNAPSDPVADVSTLRVSGAGYTGRVLLQRVVPSCTTPCQGFEEPPRWSPCLVLDLRCELEQPWTDGMEWEDPVIACGGALESMIRAAIPER